MSDKKKSEEKTLMTFERKTLRKSFGAVIKVSQRRIRTNDELENTYVRTSKLVPLLNPNDLDG
jgi:hypothetical protein